jgi:type 2 lantibiotic biosynthesis protein LanM
LRGRPKPWREERRADIARARRLASRIEVEPPWWRQFSDLYSANTVPALEDGLLAALGPIIAAKAARLRSQLSRGGCSLIPERDESLQELSASFEQRLRERLAVAATKTLVLELAVASRARLLKGSTPEARFSFFCECLADPSFAKFLLAQYPVLVRRCIAIADGWEQATRSLLARIAASESKLISAFFENKHPGHLISARALGDVHCRGHAVHVLSFQSGVKLVYKPRPVALERYYYDLIAWLNDRGLAPELKMLRTLDEGTFGWMEFVPVVSCGTHTEVARFFTRMGAHLALISMLGGTDFHSENIIACGEHPVPVDLEALFFYDHKSEHRAGSAGGATARAWAVLGRSVAFTLILPVARGFNDKTEDWVDMSALGHDDHQLTSVPVPNWAHAQTDRMRLIYERANIPPGASQPRFAGEQVRCAAYVDEVVRGFVRTYELLQKFKSTLLSRPGPLWAFAGKPVRCICRETAIYELTLFASYHPRFQRDAIACEAMLRDALRTGNPFGGQHLKLVEDAEVADLLACDVPYFSSTVGSSGVSGSDGQAIAPTTDAKPYARIEDMNERDLERQVSLIRMGMLDPAAEATAAPWDPFRRAPSPESMIATAARIGDRICELAIQDGDRCSWLVSEVVNSRRMTTTVAGIHLYDGLPGIAMFLGHLAVVTNERRYGRVAEDATREALAHYRARTRYANMVTVKLGAFRGVGGLCYALVHLAAITRRDELAVEASKIIQHYAKRAARATDLDLFEGLAGFIVTALVVARFNQDQALIGHLRPLAQRLARLTTSASCRRKPSIASEGRAGLAHGRAGVGLAFLRWAEATGETQFRTLGEDLVLKDFENAEVSRRDQQDEGVVEHRTDPLAWCRGSLGIAMAAIVTRPPVPGLFQTAWGKSIRLEIERSRPSRPVCLCHGALGRLEFLNLMDQQLLTEQLRAWRGAVLGEVVAGRWVADVAHTLESPGLMLGLAGTGHSLLRHAVGKRIPSVLVLEAVS